ncbi:hypothetical protein SAMN04488029_1108 [Reichenbachiella faecimaris]|uniref:Uncharacterized protein n=1 Tax=Reichenbachiella faecimaris TaxID=692418 RepID=A0A1W2G7V8_REIFA|nr:hypothetical protein [Reichenbachiella faecimaris]SMD32757.1 hypothetical protein SAMN04488029_1108 [Reichenbachiella faecimaris]
MAGFVLEPKYWKYSSAADYAGRKDFGILIMFDCKRNGYKLQARTSGGLRKQHVNKVLVENFISKGLVHSNI